MRILILDDDPARAEALAATAARACARGEVQIAPARHDALAALDGSALAVLAPARSDGPDGLALVRAARARAPEVPLLVLGAQDGAAPAVAAMKAGATEYVVLDELGAALDRLVQEVPAAKRLAPRPVERSGAGPMAALVGRSPAMEQVRELVRMAARVEASVLIEGETGTGKELVARAIHALGRRAGAAFVPVNCAAVPESLAESEFFGHARGAFTGAVQERPGLLQLADRGTLFLDEVEDLSPPLQAKLLRAVQEREVRPLGASALRRVDVRFVSAANRDLWSMVEAHEFRRDLYYRLRVMAIVLPPLRQRREDVPLLVEHFVGRFNRLHGTRFVPPAPLALQPFVEHGWPGNVRELENVLESLLVAASATGATLEELLAHPLAPSGQLVFDERARILRVLEEHRWNRQRAAAALGISRVTLWRRMERHGIRDPFAPAGRETA
jgi:DNA-binding NtrC family response regulator